MLGLLHVTIPFRLDRMRDEVRLIIEHCNRQRPGLTGRTPDVVERARLALLLAENPTVTNPEVAQIKAVACELPSQHEKPLSRLFIPDVERKGRWLLLKDRSTGRYHCTKAREATGEVGLRVVGVKGRAPVVECVPPRED